MNKHKSLEGALFEEWSKWLQNNHPEHGFMYDGIVNQEGWNTAKKKILFILKDYNEQNEVVTLDKLDLDDYQDKSKLFNLRYYLQTWVKKSSRWRTWDNIARWAFGLMNLTGEYFPDYWKEADRQGSAQNRVDVLSHIAVMDIKKKPGTSSCSLSQLKQYLTEYPESITYLGRQLQLYGDLEYLVCCGDGLYDILWNIIDDNELTGWQIKNKGSVSNHRYAITTDGKIIIDYRHPLLMGKNAPHKDKAYITLMRIAQEANKNGKTNL